MDAKIYSSYVVYGIRPEYGEEIWCGLYRPPAPETWSRPEMEAKIGALRTAPVLEKTYT
jgi:hypothetical protein